MILISFLILVTPVVDVFLAAADPVFPVNLFRFTPLVLACVAAYGSKKFFIPIVISALFFAALSYPSDVPALLIVLITPLLFGLRYRFNFLSEQWVRLVILALGFSLSYFVWAANSISWDVIDYKYFGLAFLIQVISGIIISFGVLKCTDFFASPYNGYEIPKNRI